MKRKSKKACLEGAGVEDGSCSCFARVGLTLTNRVDRDLDGCNRVWKVLLDFGRERVLFWGIDIEPRFGIRIRGLGGIVILAKI